jgi:hypothetical protein
MTEPGCEWGTFCYRCVPAREKREEERRRIRATPVLSRSEDWRIHDWDFSTSSDGARWVPGVTDR